MKTEELANNFEQEEFSSDSKSNLSDDFSVDFDDVNLVEGHKDNEDASNKKSDFEMMAT